MKTAPIQQNQAEDHQSQSLDNTSEGKSMAPPTFQLKTANENAPMQREPDTPVTTLTITNGNAILRGGPPGFDDLGSKIPPGTRVDILEESGKGNSAYIRVKDHDTGNELGWTWKKNTENLDKKYKNSNASYTYHVNGHDLTVFLPKEGLKDSKVNVFMFFHGIGGDYTTDKTHAVNGGYEDNPAIAAKMTEAVSNSGSIAICPQGNNPGSVTSEWAAIKAGGFQAMLSQTLKHLSADLGMTEQPLTAGNVSLAGHSAGGSALGQAALDTGATDVTLQEAGYGSNSFKKSWKKLRDWFLMGQGPKSMRVITQNNGNRHATRKPVAKGGEFSASEIVNYSKELVKAGQLPGPVTVEEMIGDGKVEEGGIVMERGFRVIGSDGKLIGSMRLYHMEDAEADHWAAASETMESSMTSGKKDQAADEDYMKNR